MIKNAFLDGFISRLHQLFSSPKQGPTPEELAARAAEDRFLGKYRKISDAALAALRRGTAHSYGWLGNRTDYPSMAGRDYRHFMKSWQNHGLYNDINRALLFSDPDRLDEYGWPKVDDNHNTYRFLTSYLKGLQPYMDKRRQAIIDDPKKYKLSHADWLKLKDTQIDLSNPSIEGLPVSEAIYDKMHEDELNEASLQAVMPQSMRDSYAKARIWGAFNPVNYKSK